MEPVEIAEFHFLFRVKIKHIHTVRLTNKTMRRGEILSYPVALLLGLLEITLVQGNECTEQCNITSPCLQRNFSECSVVCNNTGVTDSPLEVCRYSDFENDSTVECIAGACLNATFANSNVTCTGDGDSCSFSTFDQSSVACIGDTCREAHFYSSNVMCPSLFSCRYALFFACSCCDGEYCRIVDLPKCKEDPKDFCEKKFLGRNCKEWGNPACVDLIIGTFMLRVEK